MHCYNDTVKLLFAVCSVTLLWMCCMARYSNKGIVYMYYRSRCLD